MWDVLTAVGVVGIVLILGAIVMIAIDSTILNGKLESISLKFFIVGCVFFIGSAIPIMVHEENQNKDACEAAGGHYVVVRTETQYIMINNIMTPNEVDMYGCVKGE